MKKFILMLIICLTFFVASCGEKPTLNVQDKNVNLKVGEVYEITPEVTVVSKDIVKYVVADPTILSVEGSIVTALKVGSTTVTLTLADYDVTCVVSFNVEENNSVKGITITSENNIRTIKENETMQLSAKVFPDTASQTVVWTSATPEIASVSETGLVTALKAGNAEIVATSTVDETISQNFKFVVEEAEEVVVTPEKVEITANQTTCKAGETITLTAIVSPAEANQAVIWSSSDVTIATVTRGVVTALKEGTVEITVSAKGYENIKDSITLTFDPSDDPIYTKDWENMDFSTHAYYMECENDLPLKVKGVVTHVSPVSESAITYIIQNGTEGYYIYAQSALLCNVEVGKVYEIGGFKKYYRGLNEIVNVEYCKEILEEITYTVNDLGDIDPTDLDAVAAFHSSFVKDSAIFKNATVADKAYSFYAEVNGKETTFRVDPAYMTAEEFAKVNDLVSSAVTGISFEFNGVMTAFGYGKASPQILIVKASDLIFEALSTEELLEAASDVISVPNSIQFSVNDIKLPVSIDGFDNLVITWASDNTAINVEDGVVTHQSEDITVTLTATLSLDGKSYEKQFEVIVYAADNNEYEIVVSFDLDDALPAQSYGNSASKASYAEGTVTLGTPQYTWLLRNALIAAIENDRVEGVFSIRAKAGKTKAETGRVEIQHDGEYNVVEFKAAIYGNDVLGAQIQVEYSLDSGSTWVSSEDIITLDSRTLTTYRVYLPEGVKRVAIVVVENSGNRVNLDTIKLMK